MLTYFSDALKLLFDEMRSAMTSCTVLRCVVPRVLSVSTYLSGDRDEQQTQHTFLLKAHLESEVIKFSSYGFQAIREGHMRREVGRENEG